MTKKIIFRADGSSSTGLGHLYRLFSLVEIVKDAYDFLFLTSEMSTNAVIPDSYNKLFIPKEILVKQEPNWLFSQFSPKDYIIVADGYHFNSSYQKKIKKLKYTFVYIDDLVSERTYADIVINHSPYVQEKEYFKETYTKLALGVKYALIRPNFLSQARLTKKLNSIQSAFVCFGGADPIDLSLKAVEALLTISKFKKIHLVIGAAYKHNKIFELGYRNQDKIKIYKNLGEQDLIKVMQLCNFAIVPASTILYELCCVKMPILSGFFVENQKNIYTGLVEKEIVIPGGDFSNYTVFDFIKKINHVLDKNNLKIYVENQQSFFDGKSNTRLLGLINGLNITYRKANKGDTLEVYKWSNDEFVRKNSYNSAPIKFENHKIWFDNIITNKNVLFLILLVNNKPAGVVRYQKENEEVVVSILVAKQYRGQKLASIFLKQTAKLSFEANEVPILAYIKKENLASIRTFESAGYKYNKDKKVKGSDSLVYKLEKKDVE